jgi:hypothetical protein
MDAQGWYADPFAAHEARWFSAGAPTQLVRDGDVEATDPPPADTWTGPLTPAAEPEPPDGEDLRRSDESDQSAGIGIADGFAAADNWLG